LALFVSRLADIRRELVESSQDYKQLEGKAVEVDEIRPASEAYAIILDALQRYSDQRRKGFNSSHKQ
jgi:inorganic pyrophosphatase